MALIASESNCAHPGIMRASTLGIWCRWLEMFAPNEGFSLIESQPKKRSTQTGATES
jgi:hypothetical protein